MQPRRTLRPSIHRYPRKHPADHSPDTLGPLCDAANDAAKREVAQWFLFLLVMLVLFTLVGGTSHRMLFLEEPIKVPVLEVNLPLLGFYWVAPAVFLLMHFYVLAQVRELARKVTAYLTAAERDANGNTAAFLAHRHRLDIFPVVGMLANQRLGQPGIAMAAMVLSTLAIMPLLLLVFIQVQFLPYHDVATTWWHRTAIALDLGLLWWLWPRSQSGARWRRWTLRAVGGVMTGFVVAFAFTLALIPEEFLETQADKTMPVAAITREFLFNGPLDEVSRQRTSIFTRSLVLPDENFLTAEEQKKLSELGDKAPETGFRTRVLRGRNLRYAILDRADLRYADLTGANLSDAAMINVKLTRARLDSAKMQGASLTEAQMQGATLLGVDGWRLHGRDTATNFARLGVWFEQRLMREQ
ncbi:MAG: pentapeptide repeat-containing protein [Alphaproteobacteria bacterium]|nr:MAG: pentapeptide repeat-containing protein [Alphaproteobacteria bacterium]